MRRLDLNKAAKHPDVRAVGFLLLAAVAFLWRLWLNPSHILFSGFSDLLVSRAAWQELIRKTLLEHGELPFWNPHIFCGVPFIGNPGSWAFYPINWLFVLLPVNLSTSLILLVHLWIGAVGCYAYLRIGLKTTVWPALIAALLAVFGGKLLIHQLVPGHLGFLPLVWVPWCMLGVDLLVERDSWPSAAFLAAMLGVLGLSLFTQFCLYTAYLITGYFVFRWYFGGGRRLAVVGKFCASALLAGLLCAVQLLPVLSQAGSSARVAFGSLDFASAGSLGLQDFVAFLRPAVNLVAGWAGETFGWEQAYLMGLLPVLCIPLAVVHRRRRAEAIFFLAAAGLVALHALGANTPFFEMLYRFVPGSSFFRVPGRALFMLGVLLPPLVALGLECSMEKPSRRLAGGPAIALLLALAAAFLLGKREWLADVGAWLLVLSLIYGAALTGLLIGEGRKHMACAALCVCVVIETWSLYGPVFMTRAMEEELPAERLEGLRLTRWLSSDARITDAGREVFHPLIREYELVRDGGYDVNGFSPLVSKRYVRFMSRITGQPPKPEVWIPELRPDPEGASTTEPLLAYLNLRQWLCPGRDPATGQFRIFRVPPGRSLPRAYIAPSRRIVGSYGTLGAMLEPDALAGETVILEEEAPETPGTAKHGAVEYDFFSPNEIRLSVMVNAPAYLVLSEAWHPGWRCWVTNTQTGQEKEVEVYRANYVLRAVCLDSGPSQVRFRFSPRSFRIGRVLSVAGLLLILWLLLPTVLRRLRPADHA